MKVSVAILAVAGGAEAFWRMECRGTLAVGRIDPLLNYGEPAAHVHSIHGSSGFSDKAGFEDLVGADCTSCAVTQDMSAYWTPSLYFQHANGSFELVPQVGGLLSYYFLFKDAANPNSGIKAFPPGFGMLAGDAARRNYTIAGSNVKDVDPEKSAWASLGQTSQADLTQRAIGFNCLNYNKPPEGTLYRHYMPDKDYLDANCADGIRAEIMFPSCWNGKDLDSDDHRSHMAYPDLVMNGNCPKGFETKLPGLMYETIWATNAFVGKPGQFVFSNGDVQGFGYHADFMNGWDEDFLQQAVETCTNDSGKIQDCPIFNIQSEDVQRKCTFEKSDSLVKLFQGPLNEKVTGVVGDSLPGNVPIAYGPEPANGHKTASHTTLVEVPTATYSQGATVTNGDYKPGGIFKAAKVATSAAGSAVDSIVSTTTLVSIAKPSSVVPSSTTEASSVITEAPSVVAEEDGEFTAIRTEYITNGNVVSMVVIKEALEYVTVTTTTVTAVQTVQARQYSQHLHRHKVRHAANHRA
ncbi:hypothetical protein QBC32DRAFT_359474 [Pseudoneurospora amorphoporcata]|uniref:DUF1996 domain-containing protein n=1 Tax=Pseudoneurospora amorphoporcata TaxID=241081 RepID=A0AAN6SJK7_9PEZI|nr:hypothetical protein QBC32DRAFT_359474 [Pseudoneurospora amorphoporcata]